MRVNIEPKYTFPPQFNVNALNEKVKALKVIVHTVEADTLANAIKLSALAGVVILEGIHKEATELVTVSCMDEGEDMVTQVPASLIQVPAKLAVVLYT